eukprot:3414367-Pyramimonas_sp.AAC.1
MPTSASSARRRPLAMGRAGTHQHRRHAVAPTSTWAAEPTWPATSAKPPHARSAEPDFRPPPSYGHGAPRRAWT